MKQSPQAPATEEIAYVEDVVIPLSLLVLLVSILCKTQWLTSPSNKRDSCRMQMGFNMIRLWGGAALARQPFYDACDEYGLLVWQEFWITGDCNGRGATPVCSIPYVARVIAETQNTLGEMPMHCEII